MLDNPSQPPPPPLPSPPSLCDRRPSRWRSAKTQKGGRDVSGSAGEGPTCRWRSGEPPR
eukprot:CAMPEP_0118927504 /NCGR_PEP_ID=MMETSP1169-20130426/4961_1 /TAXON_ID=36882 /ORGANISM="Pyramimonas obovata, Strain CCMP722" /LENGTH=58 /DNA_ID=CAMNT_0006869269 /DNA_START=104 /DNA_END=277 /DNA_ORIENTATION=-